GPALGSAGRTAGGRRVLAVASAGVILMAEIGRRRSGGVSVFPAAASLWAPVWVLERSVCAWWAVAARLVHGGVWYGGRRLRVAAHSRRWLRRTARPVGPPVSDVAAVAEGRLSRATAPAQGD